MYHIHRYGLLGASGCGKTRILSCIVGLQSLDSGGILICGKRPGEDGSGVPGRRVGYMPQEVALNSEFTIEEVLQYFGRIYGMEAGAVEERRKYLVPLLSLEKCLGHIRDMRYSTYSQGCLVNLKFRN
jgi:ABC-type multidrug transport system ATPase subunit